ncbi:MAG: hypothetical protein WD492_12450 [Alkalispirochaeta sp.]
MAFFTGAAPAAALSVVYRSLFTAAVALFLMAVSTPARASEPVSLSAPASASAPAFSADFIGDRITEITLAGLRKTQDEVVYDLIEVEVGDPVTADLFQSIQESLLDSDLFAAVHVSGRATAADGVEVVVLLDEKWTLVPIPFFSTNGSTYQGGLIVIETNLLGRNKQLISAGFLGTDGAQGFVAYGDPAVFGSRWSAGISAGAGRTEAERLLPNGTHRRSYEYDQQRLGANVGYNFTRRAGITGGLGYERWEIMSGDSLEDGQLLESQLTAEYDGTRPLDVLRVGPRARLSARTVTYRSGWEISAGGEWAIPVATAHRIRLVASGAIGEMPTIAERMISGGDGYRTLPYQAVSADSWGTTSAVYDLSIVRADWGALVLSHFWELGGYTNDDVDPRLFYGPGGGFRVYIRQVAIPALGLDVAYNIPDNGFAFSFSLGAQM